jgi:hypothetical protein
MEGRATVQVRLDIQAKRVAAVSGGRWGSSELRNQPVGQGTISVARRRKVVESRPTQ